MLFGLLVQSHERRSKAIKLVCSLRMTELKRVNGTNEGIVSGSMCLSGGAGSNHVTY